MCGKKIIAILFFTGFCLVMNGCVTSFEQNKVGIKKRNINVISKIKGRIVIDAGHGGHDSGAVSQNGLKEKDITLDLALRVRRLLKKVMPNIQVRLTRNSDEYVSLKERVSIANKFKGDLFLSLHVNASENKKARGFEVYSLDIASDRHSERLAARENKSFTKDSRLNFVLADLRAHSHRHNSDNVANLISRGLSWQMGKYLPKKIGYSRGYNQAIFHVLFVNMPAVLTELFFISNPKEERLLRQGRFRELMARGIVLGIKKYLELL